MAHRPRERACPAARPPRSSSHIDASILRVGFRERSGHFNPARTGRTRSGVPPRAWATHDLHPSHLATAGKGRKPCGERPAGTLAMRPAVLPNAKKLRHARQALVRKSESSPKYGVKAGNIRGRLRNRAASIGKQNGIRKGEIASPMRTVLRAVVTHMNR